MRISDWSSDVCSSDLDRLLVSARIGAAGDGALALFIVDPQAAGVGIERYRTLDGRGAADISLSGVLVAAGALLGAGGDAGAALGAAVDFAVARSEEHTSELQSLMRISYAVFVLKKK